MAETNKGRSEEEVARAFVNHYYHLFDNDRFSLFTLYSSTSLLTFEGQKIYGVEDIFNKLKQLPFDQCRHLISTVDSQPSSMAGGCGGILVFVSGSIQLHGEDHPLRHFTWSLFHKEVSSSKMRCFGSIMVEVIITFIKMKSRNRNLATLSLMIITVLSWTKIVAGQEALLGKKVLPLCHRECMPICMKVTEATQEICEGACQAGCVQLQGRGTGLSATDQGVDMIVKLGHLLNTDVVKCAL
ncbi:hypothetical protein HID58_081016 [Brassica napus]|uniref:NTF2 domain-containing protein n=1 Tax=Brassica napus TaxID=3708 RepID=A0ABQ7Y9Q2_BRANA|nr:hypothetical protein HID58_081016 [Brassica napus]